MTMRQAVLAGPLPMEGERRLAKGETVEMAGDRPLPRLALSGDARVDSYRQRIGRGVAAVPRVAGPVGPALLTGGGNRAVGGWVGAGQIMMPLFERFLQIFTRIQQRV